MERSLLLKPLLAAISTSCLIQVILQKTWRTSLLLTTKTMPSLYLRSNLAAPIPMITSGYLMIPTRKVLKHLREQAVAGFGTLAIITQRRGLQVASSGIGHPRRI